MDHNQNLLVSAANGDLQGVIESLSNGADINTKDSNGFTALQFATYNSQVEVVQILIEAHADPNVFDYKNYNNFTPLHYAASFNQKEIVKALLQSQINPHVPNGEGKYPLNLTGSEEIKNVIYEDQERRRRTGQTQQPQPQQQFQPQLDQGNQPQQCRWSLCSQGGCCKKLMKKAKKIFGVLFFLFPLLYCVFTPFGFPWFIYPCGIMLSFVGFKKLKENKEELKSQGIYKLYIHTLVFTILNGLNFIACLWWRTLFFAVSIASVWGSLLIVHSLKSKYQKSKKNNGFFIHALIFGGFLIASFITYTHISCMSHAPNHSSQFRHDRYRYQGSQHHYHRYQEHRQFGCNRQLIPMFIWFLPMMIWAVILFIHHLKSKGNTEISFCGIKISYGENQNQNEIEREDQESDQEPTEQQNVEEINVEEESKFNEQNIQVLYPKVL